jgi:ERCC4-type nuclease
MKILLSPTEGKLTEKLGTSALVSSIPEEYGADILLISDYCVLPIQRKEVPHDFLISVQDGRLAKETTLMTEKCGFGIVIGEGEFKYFPDGSISTKAPKGIHDKVYKRFTINSIQKLIMEMYLVKGCSFMQTRDIYDTVRFIKTAIEFVEEPTHVGLSRRPKASGKWGSPTMSEEQLWLLQGFPGVGPGLAQAIHTKFNGVPLMWKCTLQQLREVPRIGESRAWKLWEMLLPTSTNQETE